MAPECGCTAHGIAARGIPDRTPRRVAWTALVSGFALALVPKCPLCLAAYLSVLGMSAGAAAPLARVLHPVSLILAALALGIAVARLVGLARRRGSAPTH